VVEAAVAGAADAARGEVPVAYLVVNDGFDQARVESACREKLASFKLPRRFVVVDKLPRTALGKVQKHLL
jgi:acyl-coenzyme A synthetase/AMP-(fatty) acid ligase